MLMMSLIDQMFCRSGVAGSVVEDDLVEGGVVESGVVESGVVGCGVVEVVKKGSSGKESCGGVL